MTDATARAELGPDLADGAEGTAEPEKRVGWAELFFDLVFVFAVTETSTLIRHDLTWGGLLRALIVFVPVYWVWVGTSVQTNLRDTSRPGFRISLFTVALAGIFLAVALPEAYAGDGTLFAVAYLAARLVLGGPLLLRQGWQAIGPTPYGVGMAVTGPAFVVGSFLPEHQRELVWGLAALLDLATPTVFRRRLTRVHYDAAHLAERFGLFVLIALGESVVAIGQSAEAPERLGVGIGAAVAAAFVLACGLWWVYFHFAADAVRHSLATAKVQIDIARLVLSYGHLLFIGAIILVAVGLHHAVAEPTQHLGWSGAGLLFGGTALYLASFGYTRWAMFRLVSTTRLSAAAVVLVLLPAAPYLPALASLAVLAVLLGLLNAWELKRVENKGWRALLRLRAEPLEPVR